MLGRRTWPTSPTSLPDPMNRDTPKTVGGPLFVHRPVTAASSDHMANPFIQSIASNFHVALRLLEAALEDCPDDLWETDLWPEEAPTALTSHGGLHGSAPWFLGYHALFALDYDLTAEFEPWEPPPPFDENTFAYPNRVFDKTEILDFLDYCRHRVARTLDALDEAKAARQLPTAHRFHGREYGEVLGSIPLHVVEHASQIRQFLTSSGVSVQPMPGDRAYVGDP
jgi:hypothetical protein